MWRTWSLFKEASSLCLSIGFLLDSFNSGASPLKFLKARCPFSAYVLFFISPGETCSSCGFSTLSWSFSVLLLLLSPSISCDSKCSDIVSILPLALDLVLEPTFAFSMASYYATSFCFSASIALAFSCALISWLTGVAIGWTLHSPVSILLFLTLGDSNYSTSILVSP